MEDQMFNLFLFKIVFLPLKRVVLLVISCVAAYSL